MDCGGNVTMAVRVWPHWWGKDCSEAERQRISGNHFAPHQCQSINLIHVAWSSHTVRGPLMTERCRSAYHA